MLKFKPDFERKRDDILGELLQGNRRVSLTAQKEWLMNFAIGLAQIPNVSMITMGWDGLSFLYELKNKEQTVGLLTMHFMAHDLGLPLDDKEVVTWPYRRPPVDELSQFEAMVHSARGAPIVETYAEYVKAAPTQVLIEELRTRGFSTSF
jgi:hypothetical protein